MLFKTNTIRRRCERSEAIQIDSSLKIRSLLLHFVRNYDDKFLFAQNMRLLWQIE